jgi:hypothetical protein
MLLRQVLLLHSGLAVGCVLLLPGCRPSHYGVADEEWQVMSEAERVATITGYNERQRAREERQFVEKQRRQMHTEQEVRLRNEDIQAIYNGERGQFGDNECKEVDISGHKKHRSYSGTVGVVCYQEGTLLVDVSGRDRDSGAYAFTYEAAWRKGYTYVNVSTHGRVELKDVGVYIMAIFPHGGRRGVDHREWK